MQQIPVRSSSGACGAPVALERLSAGQSDPRLLLAGCSDGLMRLWDLRASLAPVASIATGWHGEGCSSTIPRGGGMVWVVFVCVFGGGG
jgi:hypothetical protein